MAPSASCDATRHTTQPAGRGESELHWSENRGWVGFVLLLLVCACGVYAACCCYWPISKFHHHH